MQIVYQLIDGSVETILGEEHAPIRIVDAPKL